MDPSEGARSPSLEHPGVGAARFDRVGARRAGEYGGRAAPENAPRLNLIPGERGGPRVGAPRLGPMGRRHLCLGATGAGLYGGRATGDPAQSVPVGCPVGCLSRLPGAPPARAHTVPRAALPSPRATAGGSPPPGEGGGGTLVRGADEAGPLTERRWPGISPWRTTGSASLGLSRRSNRSARREGGLPHGLGSHARTARPLVYPAGEGGGPF